MNTQSKSRYKTTNWAEYNQALRQRGAFTIWFDPQMQCLQAKKDVNRPTLILPFSLP